MSNYILLMLAIGVSMDLLAISTAIGSKGEGSDNNDAMLAAVVFSASSTAMLVVGRFAAFILLDQSFNHCDWLGGLTLYFIGLQMLRCGLAGQKEVEQQPMGALSIFTLAMATGLDALIVGAGCGLNANDFRVLVILIAAVSFALFVLGFKIGAKLRQSHRCGAETFGGLLLAILGICRVAF